MFKKSIIVNGVIYNFNKIITDTMKHTAENFEYNGEEGLIKLNEQLHEDEYYIPVEGGWIYDS